MASQESKVIADFKSAHADLFAWVYDNCRDKKDLRKQILGLATVLDNVENSQNLVDDIRKKVGINPIDIDATKMSNIFPENNENYNSASGWGEYIRKIFTVDLGDIEELFDEIITSLVELYNFMMKFVDGTKNSAQDILDEMNIIIESLKNMRSNMPFLVHLQTKLEVSQSAKMSIA